MKRSGWWMIGVALGVWVLVGKVILTPRWWSNEPALVRLMYAFPVGPWLLYFVGFHREILRRGYPGSVAFIALFVGPISLILLGTLPWLDADGKRVPSR